MATLLGLNSYKKSNWKEKNQLLGFPKPVEDPPDRDKMLYPFSEFTFTFSGTETYGQPQAASFADSYLNFLGAYEPAIRGAMCPVAGAQFIIGTTGSLNGAYDWPLRSSGKASCIIDWAGSPGEQRFTFVFSKDTIVDGFYYQIAETTSGLTNTISISENGVVVYSGTWQSSATVFMRWVKISFPSILFKANASYTIAANSLSNVISINTTLNTSRFILSNEVNLANGLKVKCTQLPLSAPGAWGFSIPDVYSSALNWLSNPKNFSVPYGGYQLWTVPKTGFYRITATGACGGENSVSGNSAGNPARVAGDFLLAANAKVWIACGGRGRDGNNQNLAGREADGAGSGGASWVVLADPNNPTDNTSINTVPLLIAAGGNGAASGYWYSGNPSLFVTKSASSIQGTTDVGFSSATFAGWNGTAGFQQFRGVGGGLLKSVNNPTGGYYICGGFGGGSGLLYRYGNPGGGYEIDTSGGYGTTGIPLVGSKSYVASFAKNITREDNIDQQFGSVTVKYLYS